MTNSEDFLSNEEKDFLSKFNKYLKDVEDKNYLINEVKQLRYCILKIIQKSLLTIKDTKKGNNEVNKDELFFIMSEDEEFYSNKENGCTKVTEFTTEVVNSLINIYKKLRAKELDNIEKLIDDSDLQKKMLGLIMYQILQQGTFANSEKYPAFNVYKNEHSFNEKTEDMDDYRRRNLGYKQLLTELINKLRNKDKKEELNNFLKENKDFKEDYETRLKLKENSYMYTLEPLSIKSLIAQQPYYQYKNSFINTINEVKNEIEI